MRGRDLRSRHGEISIDMNVRKSYERAELREEDLSADPFAQFQVWMDEARAEKELIEPHAMTLATVDAHGRPSARIVLLRGFDERGAVFFTNYESRKGRDIAATGRAALLFFWDRLEREVRIEGSVQPLGAPESDAYFALRPRGHRLSAWASAQSSVVASRASLEEAMAQAEKRFPHDVPRPPNWGGYRVTPELFEFWQGRRNRVHDRIVYTLAAESWQTSRLAP